METGLDKRNRITDFFCMLPVFVFVLSILLVRLHFFSMPMTDVFWSEATDESTMSDMFNYWKAVAVIGAACLAIIVSVAAYFKESIRFKKSFLYVPAGIYLLFVLISLAFSDHKYFAFHGISEHFEGTCVLLSYVVMLFFLANAVDSERRLKFTVYCALGAATLIGLLGITQAVGHDFFTTVTGQKMMTANYTLDSGIKIWEMIDLLAASGQKVFSFSFTKGEVYQTVYNINYVPFYLALLIPVCATLFIYFGTRGERSKKGLSVIFLALYGLSLYNFFAANSASGYFGLAALFVAALIVFRKTIKRWIRPIICLMVVLGLVMGVLADRWLPEIKGAILKTAELLTDVIYADNEPQIKQDFENAPASVWIPLDYIETKGNEIHFGINGAELLVTRDDENSSFIITDGNGEQLYMTKIDDQDGVFQILDERFHDYVKLSLERGEEYTYVNIGTSSASWLFRYDGTEFLYRNGVGKVVALETIDHSGMIKDYSFGSERGRIWATTIPMLRKYVLKGSGADTFAFSFPQNDYVTLYNSRISNALRIVTDKAHNLYMQYWVNTGLISLLAWLTLVGYYLVGAVKTFRKRGFVDFSDFVNGGIFCGIIGFLFVAFFNDGSVNTMPMFYTMLGTGLAINMKDKWPGVAVTENGVSVSDVSFSEKEKSLQKKAKKSVKGMPEI